ncbi:MAG: HDOD domain-containing protein [Verrucomicrobia bacterium]|nr:HDOD domain-containing protein [Verrucomicrobiota bacterium]
MFSFFKSDPKERLKKILGNYELPRFRKTVFETLRRLRDPDSQPHQITEVMSLDPDLTSKVMRTVNSSAYAPRCKIESLDHGIMMLGRANLERIVMMLGAQSVVPSKVPRTLDVRAFWKTSAKRAVLAKGIADLVIPAQASLSFTAGFLQDISIPLLVAGREQDYCPVYEEAAKSKRDLHVLEQETFGWDHAELGAIACNEWDLPEELGASIKDQHVCESKARPDPVYFVSSLPETNGEEWNVKFFEMVKSRFRINDEQLKSLTTQCNAKADELTRLIS